jgi:hypothetical protein
MTKKTSDWLRGRRDSCEQQFTFLIDEFGYRRSLRRFRWGGFQVGYVGPGVCVLVEWFPRDEVTVWLLPLAPGEVPADWGGSGGPRGVELGVVAAAAGIQLTVSDRDLTSPADEMMVALAGQLRSSGQDMLRGDYSQVPAIRAWIRARAEHSRY